MWLTKLRPIFGNRLQTSQFLFKNNEKRKTLAVSPVFKCNHRTYKNFGHQNDPPEHPLKNCYFLFVIGLVIYNFVNFKK